MDILFVLIALLGISMLILFACVLLLNKRMDRIHIMLEDLQIDITAYERLKIQDRNRKIRERSKVTKVGNWLK